jgi:hypothetical protein
MVGSILIVFAVVALASLPAAAAADSLLSGYGGPGEGNQAILGSALLNGPSNGDGGGTAGGASAGASASNVAAASGPLAETRPQGARGARASKPAASGTRVTRGSHAYPVSAGLARAVSGDSGTLGLSGEDVLYLVLAVAALTLTGAVTKQLVRGGDRGVKQLTKGMHHRIRGTE